MCDAGARCADEQEKNTAKKSVSMAGDEFDALNSVGRCPLRSASSPVRTPLTPNLSE